MTPPDVAPPALDHGLVGNGSVLALVSPRGAAIEWLCMPRFDSPSVFGRILDATRGGTFRFLVGGVEPRGVTAYEPATNVLVTRFEDAASAWEVVDFAPRLPNGWQVDAPIRLVRLVRPIRGHVRLSVDFDPRLDYARGHTELVQLGMALEVRGPGGPLHLESNASIGAIIGGRELALTRSLYFSLSYGVHRERTSLATIEHELALTIEGWRVWSQGCALPRFAPDIVLRSALCLKLHAHHDSGAIIAATTTSIPEAVGTERTWDYRYCWLRDAAFVVEALRRLGDLRAGERFLDYLLDIVEAGPLQPLYAIDGARSVPEEVLGHLAGFGGTGPVRIGNAAALQQQNDLMGEVLLCLETLLGDPRVRVPERGRFFALVRRLVEDAIRLAPEPDTSIWEFRTMLRNYTFSRAMCWVAIERGARMAARFGEHTLAVRWQAAADRERAIVLARGWSAERGYFTQALDGQHPDASLLLLPTIGLVDGRDPRFVSTLVHYERLLVDGGLMLRYRNEDDFGATTSAFTMCSFWWAEALAHADQLDRAVAVFEGVVRHANPVGLFSEDVEPGTGRLLGNFPQAYTHVGLINAAATIGALLEARSNRVRAWA